MTWQQIDQVFDKKRDLWLVEFIWEENFPAGWLIISGILPKTEISSIVYY